MGRGALGDHWKIGGMQTVVFNGFFRHLTIAFVLFLMAVPSGYADEDAQDLDIALSLAELLRAARTVVANAQSTINDPDRTAAGPTGEAVLTGALGLLEQAGSDVPELLNSEDRRGEFLTHFAASIVEVVDESRPVIDQHGVGFKGFVPAVFARLTNERFGQKAEGAARVKVTAPIDLVRNRRARPDTWERAVIEQRFLSNDWERGERHVEVVSLDGREAFRVMVPEYYGQGCLACHGSPAGELDITGYPKEGAPLDALGGAISIALFR